MVKLKVRFTAKLFASPEGFSVYAAEPTLEYKKAKVIKLNKYGNFTVSGNYSIEQNEMNNKVFTISIEEDLKAKYPCSYRMVEIHYEFPNSAKEQWLFLKESNIVTTNQYVNLKRKFKDNDKILDIIINQTSRIEQVTGFGAKSSAKLKTKLELDKGKALIYQNFGKIDGIGPAVINQFTNWNVNINDTIKCIKEDPFSILELRGVGFLLADAIRAHLKIPNEDRERCLHGIKYYITDSFASSGNTYADLNLELRDVSNKLNVSFSVLVNYIKDEMSKGKVDKKYGLKFFGHYVTTESLYNAENIVYNRTQSLMNSKKDLMPEESWNENKGKLLAKQTYALSDEQHTFLDLVNKERILLLVGPGGAGKSWVTNLACNLIWKTGKKIGLYAPTARAAKIMTEYIGVTSSTIHRGLLRYSIMEEDDSDYDDEGYGDLCPDDILIIDEASMIDSELMAAVYKAMRPEARIIIIGDEFQLSSVGPGNILYDFIHSLNVPTVFLTKIYRQSEDSNIINVATSLREGTFRLDEYETEDDMGDIKFINEDDNATIKKTGIDYYRKFYETLGEEEIMFLSPVNKGVVGRKKLNKEIQSIANGNTKKPQLTFGKNAEDEDDQYFYREGDYITISKNNYSLEDENGDTGMLINGDIGRLYKAHSDKIIVDIDGRLYRFEKDEVQSNVEHLWVTTIHKAQGGQANAVIIVIPSNSWGLSANMLYTAITRAKKKCIIIGDFKAMNRASKSYANFRRKTMISLQTEAKKVSAKSE